MKTLLWCCAALLTLAGCEAGEPAPTRPATYISPMPALAPADAVIYEVFIAGFSPAGTLAGMLPRLDSIRLTGANVVWLMPPYPTHSSPYAVDDYQSINPEFGDLDAFDAFVEAAHRRGLRVMLDWVANHTSFHHPWVTAHPDWYTRDARGNIAHPMPQWTDVADLDYSRPALRREMIATMKFWVSQHGVDGFRCDAADLLPADFWQQALPELRQLNPNLLLLAEGRQASHYAAGFHWAFGWDFHASLLNVFGRQAPASSLAAAHAEETRGLPAGRYRLRFTTNHDEMQGGAPDVRFGSEAAARAAYVATLAFGATPLLYNGQEAGDPARLSAPRRTPIRWGLDPSAGRFYRGLLKVFREQPALRQGTVEALAAGPDVLAVRRRLGSAELAVLVNLRSYPAQVALPPALQGRAWVDALTGAAVPAAATMQLPPYGYVVWRQ